MENFKTYFKRLSNPGSIVSLAVLIGSLLMQFGVRVDMEWVDTTIRIVCAILVTIGILNNPTTGGIDLPTGKINQNE